MTNTDDTSKNSSDVNDGLFLCGPRTTVNSSTNTSSNWFRSIPRRIRKFISKQSRHKRFDQTSNDFNKSNGQTNSIGSHDNADGLDETNLYSIVDQLGNSNDEEVAMIRATAQMARYMK